MSRKRILIAPLDWGLGHATRCIPVINELLAQNAEVVIAADRRPAELLKKEFPELQHVRFPGYVIDYPVDGSMAWKISRQLPVFFRGVAEEHRVLESLVKEHHIDAVISDNRWGAYSSSIPSIYMVHQLRIMLPPLIAWGQFIVDFANARLIAPYNEYWIPDHQGTMNLSGDLCHPSVLPKNAHFIGPLSRFSAVTPSEEPTIDVLAILSGPEPQRTLIETILVDQLKRTSLRALVVRGTPERNVTLSVAPNVTLVSALNTKELTEAIAASRIIISRPGYSTVMDYAALGVKAIFIPTPQQTEQEYLAKRLMARNISYSEPQSTFELERSLDRSRSFTGFTASVHDNQVLRERITQLLKNA